MPSSKTRSLALALTLAAIFLGARARAFDETIPKGGPIAERAMGMKIKRAFPEAKASPSPPAAAQPAPAASASPSPEEAEKRRAERIAELKRKIEQKKAELAAVQKAMDERLRQQVEALKEVPR